MDGGSIEATWYLPGVVPAVVAALDAEIVQEDGVAGGRKKSLISLAISGWSIERVKGKSMALPFSAMGQSRRYLVFWGEVILSMITCMPFAFLRASMLARGPVVVASPQILEGRLGFI